MLVTIRSLILVLAGAVAASAALLFARRDEPAVAMVEREVAMDWSRVSSRDLNIASVFLTARDQGVRKALDSLEVLASGDDKLRGMGHVLAHALGRFAIAQKKDVAVLAQCREIFQAGCYHGALEGHFAELPDVQPASVTSLCDMVRQAHPEAALPALECAHGLGHGLLTRFGYSLDRATQLCDALTARSGATTYRRRSNVLEHYVPIVLESGKEVGPQSDGMTLTSIGVSARSA